MSEQTQIVSTIDSSNNREQAKPLSPRDFVLRYLKYVPWIIICVALAMIFAFISLRYATLIYHVQSSILIKNERQSAGNTDAKLDELIMSQPSINLSNEIEILKSRLLVQRVVNDLNLQTQYYYKGEVRSTLIYNDGPFRLQILDNVNYVQGFGFYITMLGPETFTVNKEKKVQYFGKPFNVGNNVCVLMKEHANFSESKNLIQKFQINWNPLPAATEQIINSLKVSQLNDQATILTLSMETQNITMAEDILNTIMSVYDSMNVEDKNRISNSTLHFIDDRLDALKDSLGGVEGKMRIFLERNQAFDIEGQSKNIITALGETQKTIGEQELHKRVADWLIEYISNSENLYKLVPTDLGIQEPSLIQLVSEYNRVQLEREGNLKTTTINNPLIQAFDVSLKKLRVNILEALKNVKQSYLLARNSLSEYNLNLQGQIKSMPGKNQQALTIQRNQKILEDLYSFLLQKKLETSISSASTISNSRVLESALGKNTPVKPDRKALYLSYFLIGLVIPVAVIAVFELMSDKVNNRMEIERATQAPILGEVGHSDDSQTLVVTRNSRRFIAEQFRIIRTNLQYIIGKDQTQVILVTSSFSGEGKSFVSTNMGAVMALSGKRTVIMEFDIRKPKIVTSLDLKRKMGITNYIIGRASLDELPIPVQGVENLYVIACGPIPPNPSELLLSPRLKSLMDYVKENFEVVIMDTAPVGLVSDAVTLGVFANATIYIVRRGHTVRRLLGLIQDLYLTKKLPSISILLNDVKLEGGYYGGYYGGYGYYGYGYGHEGGYFEKEGQATKKNTFPRRIRRWWVRYFG
jgi:tyrosine-protein kinase Etk/Wzc